MTIDLEAITARAEKATEGPWEHGDRQCVAGVMPERFGEGRCVSCAGDAPLTWTGKRDINGKRMLAHVHTRAEPWWEHGLYAVRPSGSLIVVNDTDEYGYMTVADAEFIAAARTDVPALVAEVRRLTAIVERVQSLADVVAKLQPADPDTGDRDVSWLELLEVLDPS